MVFRIANEKDLNGIIKLYKILNSEDSELSNDIAIKIWKNIISSENFKYFVAIENDEIISSCNISIIPNLTRNGKSFGIIENVITNESYRKKGIGTKVIQMAIEFAKESNCYKIVLLSSKKRVEAHSFYEKLGFNKNSKIGFEMRLL